MDLVLALLIVGGGRTLWDVACAVLGRAGVCRADYEELLVGPARAARVERLGSGGGGLVEKAGIVAVVETLSPGGVPSGLLGRGDGILRWRHMAVSARVVAPK